MLTPRSLLLFSALCACTHAAPSATTPADTPGSPSTSQAASHDDVRAATNLRGMTERDRSALEAVLRDNFAPFAQCYDRELDVTPRTIETEFRIQQDGRVSDVSARGEPPSLRACIAAQLQRLRFEPRTDVTVTAVRYPFHFE